MRQCTDRRIRDNTSMLQDFLKRFSGLRSPALEKESKSAKPNWVDRTPSADLRSRKGQLIRPRNLKYLDGLSIISTIDLNGGSDAGNPIVVHFCIERQSSG